MSAAQAEYAQRQAEARQLVKRLSKALDQHARKSSGQPWNRANAGDLGACTERLLEALNRLGALTQEELQGQS